MTRNSSWYPELPADDLPDHADAIIIGGGIIGTSAALDLAKAGLNVLLLDKGPIGREQSGRNWGWCRQLGRDRRELPLIRQSLAVWDELQQQTDVGFHRPGILRILEQDRDLPTWEAWCQAAAPHGIRGEMLDADKVRALNPDYQKPIAGGVWLPDDGCAEPSRAAPKVAELARTAGARVRPNCAVQQVLIERGRATGVITEHGTVRGDRLLVAAGAWSAKLLRPAGVDLPQAYVLASVLRTGPTVASGQARIIGSPWSAVRQRDDGGWSIGSPGRLGALASWQTLRWARTFAPTMRELRADIAHPASLRSLARGPMPPGQAPRAFTRSRVLDPKPDGGTLNRAWQRARAAHAFLQDAHIEERWAGVIDGTPDAIPVVGPAGHPDGLWIATGFSGHGFGLGPGAGRMAAALMAEKTPPVDPHPFRLQRFTDGSQFEIEVSY